MNHTACCTSAPSSCYSSLSKRARANLNLEFVGKLNVNQRSEETESATMRHPEGEQPVMFVLPQIKIAPGPLKRLQASRAPFVALHASLRRACCPVRAHAVELLLALAHSMHLESRCPCPRGGRAV